MWRGNQYRGCEYDDLQNLFDMKSDENPYSVTLLPGLNDWLIHFFDLVKMLCTQICWWMIKWNIKMGKKDGSDLWAKLSNEFFFSFFERMPV